ncbi:MAG: TIGR01777 family protein [Fibrobacteres bacterium]|nr:TIGR01777 family protein [Fibrobacterota bacterium]
MTSKTIAVAGASGLIASAAIPQLEASGWSVVRLVRRSARHAGERKWDPREKAPHGLLDGCQAVLNLCGHSIADWPWTKSTRRSILESRVLATSSLAKAAVGAGIETFVNGSAMGYYGSQGDRPLSEFSPTGAGFLAEVCRSWERALSPLDGKSTRTAELRTGIVLSSRGGSLPPQWRAWKRGLGAILGDGSQWTPWIQLEDAARAIVHILEQPGLHGPINLCSPHPAIQRDFSHALATAVGSTTRLRAPGWLLRGLLGDFATELLLSSHRGDPKVLTESGFTWNFPRLEEALAKIRSEFAK